MNESNVAFGLDTEPKRIRTAKRAFRHRVQPGKFFKRLTALIPAAQARCQISYTLSGVKCRSEPLVIRDTELGGLFSLQGVHWYLESISEVFNSPSRFQ
jgi:hypothetical protein